MNAMVVEAGVPPAIRRRGRGARRGLQRRRVGLGPPDRLPTPNNIPETPASSTSPTRPPHHVGRDVPCTPLCPPSTSRPEARYAQCACLAIHGERAQGASLKHGGRPSLARAAWCSNLRDLSNRGGSFDSATSEVASLRRRRWVVVTVRWRRPRRPVFRGPPGTRQRTRSPQRPNAELELGDPGGYGPGWWRRPRRPVFRVPPGTRQRTRSPQRPHAELELGGPHRRPPLARAAFRAGNESTSQLC